MIFRCLAIFRELMSCVHDEHPCLPSDSYSNYDEPMIFVQQSRWGLRIFYQFPEGQYVLEDLLTTTSTFFEMFILDVQSPKGIIPVCCGNNASNHICPKVMEVVKIMVLNTCTNINLLGSKKNFIYFESHWKSYQGMVCTKCTHTCPLQSNEGWKSQKKRTNYNIIILL